MRLGSGSETQDASLDFFLCFGKNRVRGYRSAALCGTCYVVLSWGKPLIRWQVSYHIVSFGGRWSELDIVNGSAWEKIWLCPALWLMLKMGFTKPQKGPHSRVRAPSGSQPIFFDQESYESAWSRVDCIGDYFQLFAVSIKSHIYNRIKEMPQEKTQLKIVAFLRRLAT